MIMIYCVELVHPHPFRSEKYFVNFAQIPEGFCVSKISDGISTIPDTECWYFTEETKAREKFEEIRKEIKNYENSLHRH